MRSSRAARTLALGILASAVPVLAVQTTTVLTHEGAVLPGTTAAVGTIHEFALNGVDGYVALITTADGRDRLWGSVAGEAPGVFFTPAAGSLDVHPAFNDAGSFAYTFVQPNGVKSIRVDSTVVVRDGDPYPPLPGYTWSDLNFKARGLTNSGEPIWAGNITDGTTSTYGIFRGFSPVPVLLEGDSIPGAGVITTPQVATFRESPDGTHTIVKANPAATLLVDGNATYAHGALLQQSQIVPPELGGDGSALFEDFAQGDITDAGDWTAVYYPDSIGGGVLHNGDPVWQVGDVVDGVALTGGPYRGARLNAAGDMISLWTTGPSWPGGFFVLVRVRDEDRIVLRNGDPLDLDGDGADDATFAAVVYDAYFDQKADIGERRADDGLSVFVQAWVDTAGTPTVADDLVALLRLDLPLPVGTPVIAEMAPPAVTAFPNPFVTETRIRLSLPRRSDVGVSIHDAGGRLIRRLFRGTLPGGTHVVAWTGDTDRGQAPAGVYFYRVVTNGEELGGTLVRAR